MFAGKIIPFDLADDSHTQALVDLLNEYAQEPTVDGAPLPNEVQQNLIQRLRNVEPFRGFLAEVDGAFVGIAVCFMGFSTFKAKPLINIHDLCVTKSVRGQGAGSALLKAVDDYAQKQGCACVTLEVRADNLGAQRVYRRHGFQSGDPQTDAFGFWKKPIGS